MPKKPITKRNILHFCRVETAFEFLGGIISKQGLLNKNKVRCWHILPNNVISQILTGYSLYTSRSLSKIIVLL